jgi:hypothetical protein
VGASNATNDQQTFWLHVKDRASADPAGCNIADSVVKKFDVDLDIIDCCSGTRQGADAGSGPATTADHPTEFAVTDADVKTGTITERGLGHGDLIGFVHN